MVTETLERQPGRTEYKRIALKDNEFLLSLTKYPFCWMDYSPKTIITVIAVEGQVYDWAAYMERPFSRSNVEKYGNKLPQEVAELIFPNWERLHYRRWRIWENMKTYTVGRNTVRIRSLTQAETQACHALEFTAICVNCSP